MTTTTKISIGNGKYCYSGPTCRLHGQAQIDAARNALIQARNAYDNVKTAEEMLDAQAKVAAAESAYDATTEGLSTLREAYEDETDSFRKLELQVRLHRAEEVAKKFQKEEEDKATTATKTAPQADDNGLVPVVFPASHTYDVPTYNTPNHGEMYAPTLGSKYTGYRNVTEIAKDVRADIKEATAKGYLPKGLKYSVKVDKFSGGASIRVTVQNTKDSEMLTKDERFGGTQYSEDNKMLRKRVGTILHAYNSRASYPEYDYSNNLYYGTVEVEEESRRKFRLREAARAKRKRDEKPLRERFVRNYATNPLNALSNIQFSEHQHESTKATIGRLPGTHVWVTVAKRPSSGVETVSAFDFSDADEELIPQIPDLITRSLFRSRGLVSRNIL